jgi:hypothetical protein
MYCLHFDSRRAGRPEKQMTIEQQAEDYTLLNLTYIIVFTDIRHWIDSEQDDSSLKSDALFIKIHFNIISLLYLCLSVCFFPHLHGFTFI